MDLQLHSTRTHSLLGASYVVSGSSGTLRSVNWYSRRFEITYHSHLQRSSALKKFLGCLTLKDVKNMLSRNVENINLRCVTSQKSEDFMKKLHFNLFNRLKKAKFVAIISNILTISVKICFLHLCILLPQKQRRTNS